MEPKRLMRRSIVYRVEVHNWKVRHFLSDNLKHSLTLALSALQC